VTLGDLAKYSMTRSIARSLCVRGFSATAELLVCCCLYLLAERYSLRSAYGMSRPSVVCRLSPCNCVALELFSNIFALPITAAGTRTLCSTVNKKILFTVTL